MSDLQQVEPVGAVRRQAPPIIEARGFGFYYGETQALKDVVLSVYPQSVLAIIGPSGCGKSTFLRCINRMNEMITDTRAEGSLTIAGQDVYGQDVDPVRLRRSVGMVFQQPNPFPKSIYDNVAYGPRMQGVRDRHVLAETVERSLKRAALWDEIRDRLNESALSLSGGQQQRLCIARAIAVEPEVVLMDEPASALDPVSTAKIEELIIELKARYTIVIVTHNMQQAGRISDETAFFLNGEVIEWGATKDIFFNPGDERTEAYISGRFG